MGNNQSSADSTRCRPLDQGESDRVLDLMSLVGPCVDRFLSRIPWQHRDQQRDDLFQEGCLGLIEAVQKFEGGSAAALEALAECCIRQAVGRAYRQRAGARSGERKTSGTSDRIRLRSLGDADGWLPDRSRAQPAGAAGDKTIGAWVRQCYDTAVAGAEAKRADVRAKRCDNRPIIRLLVEGRFMVPEPGMRVPLRQIARQVGASLGRVATCNQQMRDTIRHLLEADPEFAVLMRHARRSPSGMATAVDASLQEALARACARHMRRRFLEAPPTVQGQIMCRLIQAYTASPAVWVVRQYIRLDRTKRVEIMKATDQWLESAA